MPKKTSDPNSVPQHPSTARPDAASKGKKRQSSNSSLGTTLSNLGAALAAPLRRGSPSHRPRKQQRVDSESRGRGSPDPGPPTAWCLGSPAQPSGGAPRSSAGSTLGSVAEDDESDRAVPALVVPDLEQYDAATRLAYVRALALQLNTDERRILLSGGAFLGGPEEPDDEDSQSDKDDETPGEAVGILQDAGDVDVEEYAYEIEHYDDDEKPSLGPPTHQKPKGVVAPFMRPPAPTSAMKEAARQEIAQLKGHPWHCALTKEEDPELAHVADRAALAEAWGDKEYKRRMGKLYRMFGFGTIMNWKTWGNEINGPTNFVPLERTTHRLFDVQLKGWCYLPDFEELVKIFEYTQNAVETQTFLPYKEAFPPRLQRFWYIPINAKDNDRVISQRTKPGSNDYHFFPPPGYDSCCFFATNHLFWTITKFVYLLPRSEMQDAIPKTFHDSGNMAYAIWDLWMTVARAKTLVKVKMAEGEELPASRPENDRQRRDSYQSTKSRREGVSLPDPR